MGDFADCPNWKLINDFTIHEDKNLKDRPFMRTCVPQVVNVEVTSFDAIKLIAWPDDHNADRAARSNVYDDRSYIRGNGKFKDTIIVFNMSAGEVASFSELSEVTIRSLPPGKIGGKNMATSFDGIPYSGMSSRTVPEDGLMADEPGALVFLPEEKEHPKSKARLIAEVFIDGDKFRSLFELLTAQSQQVRSFRLRLLTELFESEVSASLSEYWMPRDYGLLRKGDGLAQTKARIESISFLIGAGQSKDVEEKDGELEEADGAREEPSYVLSTALAKSGQVPQAREELLAILKYQKLLLTAVIVLAAVILFAHS